MTIILKNAERQLYRVSFSFLSSLKACHAVGFELLGPLTRVLTQGSAASLILQVLSASMGLTQVGPGGGTPKRVS